MCVRVCVREGARERNGIGTGPDAAYSLTLVATELQQGRPLLLYYWLSAATTKHVLSILANDTSLPLFATFIS